jgi:hypothetical protein
VIVAVPAETPVTTPVTDPTVAMLVVLLLQVLPPASLSVVVDPVHTVAVPVIADKPVFTVTTVVV